jgi:hypothetical protein
MDDLYSSESKTDPHDDQDRSKPEATTHLQRSATQQAEPAILDIPNVVKDEKKQASIKGQDANSGITSGEQDILDRIKAGERWMIFFTAIVAFTTVAQVIQSGCNNSSTSKQVDKIIAAANTQTEAAQKIENASLRNAAAAESFSKSAITVKDQTRFAVNEFRRMTKSAEKSNLQNLQFFAEGNRPWLFLAPDPGDTLKIVIGLTDIPVVIKNIGKTPAIKMTEPYLRAKVFTPIDDHIFAQNLVLTIPSSDPRSAIVTSDTPVIASATLDHALTPQEYVGLLANPPTLHLVVYGKLEYENPLGPYKPGDMFSEVYYLYDLKSGKSHWIPNVRHNIMK